MAKNKPTLDQARAFVEALTGYDGTDENGEGGTPKSPAALTHLEAVLGLGRVPNPYRIFVATRDSRYSTLDVNRAKAEVYDFITYLRDMAEVIECAIGASEAPQTPAEAAAQARDGGA